MAGVRQVINLLFPPGNAWRLRGTLWLLLDGIADTFERVKDFLSGVLNESIPGNAEITLSDWFAAFGIAYYASLPLAEKRQQAKAAYTSAGGQSLGYIKDQIQIEFPNVYLTEDVEDVFQFHVLGDVPTSRNYLRLLSIVARITPAHLESLYNIRILAGSNVARCSLGITGIARTGKAEPD